MMRIPMIILILLLGLHFPGRAQEGSPFSFRAGIDLYYGYDFNEPVNRNRQYVTVAARHYEFNLNWGFLQASYEEDRVRANLGLHTGTYPIFNYANEPSDLVKLIAEANAGVRLFEKVWLDVGVMPSHIGYENTFSFYNEMYTHSFMAEHTPYFSTGAQLSAAVSDNLDVRFVVLNGWQNIIETNDAKSVGVQVNFRPMESLELNYSNYLGNESTDPDDAKVRFYNHFYGKYIFTEQFHIVGSFDIGTQELINSTENGTVFAFLGIAQYRFSERFHVAVRAEHFNDPDEILVGTGTPNGFTNTNVSLNLTYEPLDFVRCRIEGRSYTSPDDIYDAGPTDSQNTFLLVGSVAVNLVR